MALAIVTIGSVVSGQANTISTAAGVTEALGWRRAVDGPGTAITLPPALVGKFVLQFVYAYKFLLDEPEVILINLTPVAASLTIQLGLFTFKARIDVLSSAGHLISSSLFNNVPP